jgi:peptidoglycan/LPS O-acetylase OafA/YrhL
VKINKRLEFLDALRFVAVMMVVVFHYTFNGIVNGKIDSIQQVGWLVDFTKYGYLGVELFFMISGYVIFFSSQIGSASRFIVGRVVRLYPAYWVAVLFTSCFAFFWGGEMMSITLKMVVANLTMLQSFMNIGDVDGVYWTLLYELKFYAAVFFFLIIGYQRHLRSIFVYWPVIFCAALLLDQQHRTFAGGYYYYFCAGALFGVLKNGLDWRVVLSLVVTFLLCIAYSSGKAQELTLVKSSQYSEAVIGAIIFSFFLIFSLQNIDFVQSLKIPFSRLLGSMTYQIYLIHAHFGYMLISQIATEENKFLAYLAVVTLVLFVSYIINLFVEDRLGVFWRHFFGSTIGRFVDSLQARLTKK